MKGREPNVLFSTAVNAESRINEVNLDEVNTVTKSTSRSKRKSTKKRARKQVHVKNAPKRKYGKQKNNNNTKSFKTLKDLKLGSKISGKVVDVCDFGAFVNIGYATRGSRAGTALLHISQLSDKKIKDIRDIIKVGDNIEDARVINIDLKKGEVGLSLRPRRPKRRDFTTLSVGTELDGRVDSIVPYGVFVDVGVNVNALLHISRITGGAIENVRNHLNEGDPVSVHVIDMNKTKKKIAVSMLDKKADQYLDRRMSQRLKTYYGSASSDTKTKSEDDKSRDLEYFDIAIRELEEALSGREE
eukprot:CAMPEP_0172573114 /NCGR_PEP_ID=MMETSP1067-20121228/136022_1 /TAXON_ID=265564 ORGANISM="Thalassiosira punctigera, Strain Tpunct2005C2" /NCGR_SAMPLE_ID=MMETSP1067 /ASSEMBLY_ACC=CAM_ASM_000444 /LENGTH=300 /DNA_ID=CAMNT_0013365711 /DNA_START=631 /DNA_END=1533 /DNA_ORIENTATION=-